MCGIVGYVGPQDALDVVLEGLRRLEYRGYDSAGIAVRIDGSGDGELTWAKKAGKLANLEKALADGTRVQVVSLLARMFETHAAERSTN